jgi:hypothetical protein
LLLIKLWVRLISLCISIKSIFEIDGTLFTVCLERKSKHITVSNFEVLELFVERLSSSPPPQKKKKEKGFWNVLVYVKERQTVGILGVESEHT